MSRFSCSIVQKKFENFQGRHCYFSTLSKMSRLTFWNLIFVKFQGCHVAVLLLKSKDDILDLFYVKVDTLTSHFFLKIEVLPSHYLKMLRLLYWYFQSLWICQGWYFAFSKCLRLTFWLFIFDVKIDILTSQVLKCQCWHFDFSFLNVTVDMLMSQHI